MTDVATKGLVIERHMEERLRGDRPAGYVRVHDAETADVDRPAGLDDPDGEARDLRLAHGLLNKWFETLDKSVFARLGVKLAGRRPGR